MGPIPPPFARKDWAFLEGHAGVPAASLVESFKIGVRESGSPFEGFEKQSTPVLRFQDYSALACTCGLQIC